MMPPRSDGPPLVDETTRLGDGGLAPGAPKETWSRRRRDDPGAVRRVKLSPAAGKGGGYAFEIEGTLPADQYPPCGQVSMPVCAEHVMGGENVLFCRQARSR
jgi:hypothetical protein